ncbi:MAG: HAD family hydrolase, partial [Candidatus Nanopelagicales bacterium]
TERRESVLGYLFLAALAELIDEQPLEWRPGAAELLRACQDQGIATGLVSATYRQLIHTVSDVVAQETGGRGFDVSVAGDEVTDGKPHPEPYLTAADRLGVDIARCVVIEDSPTGVAAGRASGALVVAVPHMVAIEPGPRLIVRDSLEGVTPADLARWLADAER